MPLPCRLLLTSLSLTPSLLLCHTPLLLAHAPIVLGSADPDAYQPLQNAAPGVPQRGCQVRPKQKPPEPNIETVFVPGLLTLDRFRENHGSQPFPEALAQLSAQQANWIRSYRPQEKIALAHQTNFGERYRQDYFGQPVDNEPIVVLHETVISGPHTLKLFQTNHPQDRYQVSYHALIMRDGTIYYLVPPDKRAFGAGTSVHAGDQGDETVRTNPSLNPSVNNFAYHVSFVSPVDGRNSQLDGHSGYTTRQYYSAAWLLAKTGVPMARITTHKAVDRKGNRSDPRSFNRAQFERLLALFPQTKEIQIGCP